MTQTQFLLLTIAAIPFANCLFARLWKDIPSLANFVNKLSPILFLINVVGLHGNIKHDNSYLVLAEAMRGISLGFAIDEIALIFLFLLSFFWLIFAFYSQSFLQIGEVKNADHLKVFFVLILAIVNLIIISKNLLTTLFFYNCLVLICHFFAVRFLHKSDTKISRLFTLLLYLESVFFFLAIVATYKFTAQIEFVNGGIIPQNFDQTKHSLLLALYFSGLFLSVLLPCYPLYRNITLNPLVIYILFFLAYGFSSLYIFVKLLNFVFGFKGFTLIISKIGLNFFEWIFLINIGVASLFLLLSKNLKSSFFYLFFQQFSFVLFSVIIFVIFGKVKIYFSLFSFFLSLTLIFLCIANFALYLGKLKSSKLEGHFYDLKITAILFAFGIFNLIGIAPAVGAVEKFFLIKIIIQKKLLLSALILVVNFLGLSLFAWKALFPLTRQKGQPENNDSAKEIARQIDFDSNLILTPLTVVIAMFLGLIFFPFLTNLASG